MAYALSDELKIIELGWHWKSLTTSTVSYPNDSWASCCHSCVHYWLVFDILASIYSLLFSVGINVQLSGHISLSHARVATLPCKIQPALECICQFLSANFLSYRVRLHHTYNFYSVVFINEVKRSDLRPSKDILAASANAETVGLSETGSLISWQTMFIIWRRTNNHWSSVTRCRRSTNHSHGYLHRAHTQCNA